MPTHLARLVGQRNRFVSGRVSPRPTKLATFILVVMGAAFVPSAATAQEAISDPSTAGTSDATPGSAPALCDPAVKLATPWRPASEPRRPSIPGLPEHAFDGEGPHIGTAISEHHGPIVDLQPLKVRPKHVERTSQLGFSYRAPGATSLRVWVVMNETVARVAYPYLKVGAEPVKLGVRTVQHPRQDRGKIHVKLDREAAYGVGPFLRVALTLCAAATGPNGNVTLTGRRVTLEAF